MSIISQRLEQISCLQKQIEQKKAALETMKEDLKKKLDIIENLSEATKNLVSQSGSSAQERRRVKTLDLYESIEQHRNQVAEIEDAIGKCEGEIEGLKKEKRDLEESSS